MCALHTLNNLFQNPHTFTKTLLDQLCLNLSPNNWINPHKSFLGLGNYDVNVVMAALQLHQCEMTWWDRRRTLTKQDVNSCLGMILNLPSASRLGGLQLPFKSQHWLAIRRFGSVYYNLDSKLPQPEAIGTDVQLVDYLTKQLKQDNHCQLFMVHSLNPCTLAEAEEMSN
nr:EOG090X0HOM [Polyphemus pediculus]